MIRISGDLSLTETSQTRCSHGIRLEFCLKGRSEGMVALYEPGAALARGDGRIAVGTDAIRKFYTDLLATGRTFDLGDQRPSMLRENLALTSTRLPNGIVGSRSTARGCG